MQRFEAVYSQYRDLVFRFAIHCVGRREIAEEIAADAFLRLHQNWSAIDRDKLPAWLLTVVKNRAADHWRRVSLEKRYMLDERPTERLHFQEPATGLFENQALKPVHRICLVLRYVQEMTLAEIAAYLGLSEVQVKGHLQYSRALLRKQFSTERTNE
jgi:RNA polymerase sigma-70 factor (ECF subfamily)